MTIQNNPSRIKPNNPIQSLNPRFKFQNYLTPTVLLVLIVLFGSALRLVDLGSKSYWIDEMSTLVEARQSISQLLTSGRLDQPPAFYIPFHYWLQLFGSNETNTRLFSTLTGIASIIIIYLIGSELFSEIVGLLSAFLMAISGFQIYYSQITRFYSYFEFMVLLSFLFLILALKKKKIIYFAFYTIASIFMLYSHTFGVFILAAQNLFFLVQWKKFKQLTTTWFICQIFVFLTFVPYFFILVIGKSGIGESVALNIGKMTAPYLLDPLHTVYKFILPSRRIYGLMIVLNSFIAAGFLLMVGISFYAIRQGRNQWLSAFKRLAASLKKFPDLPCKFLLLSCWLVCPIILPFIISFILIPIYKDYYTIGAAPALYLLLAFGLYYARKVIPLVVSISVLVVLIAPSLGFYYSHNIMYLNEQWREAAKYVESNSVPNDVIVFAPNENIGIQQKTFNWYYRGTLPGCGLGVPLTDPEVRLLLNQCISGHERFWVIIRGTNEDSPHNRYTSFFLNPNQNGFSLLNEHDFVGVSVYLFTLTK